MMEGHERYDGEAPHPNLLDCRRHPTVSCLVAGRDGQEPGLTERLLGQHRHICPNLIDNRSLELLPVLLEREVPCPLGFQQQGYAAHVAGKQGGQRLTM